MELTPRKREILKAVIDAFIATGEPQGSKAIMDKLHTPVSSATIRNEMNDLEKMGYLEHPHTSAGRVPTKRGYRIFVDSLMEGYSLSFEETLLMNSLLTDEDRDPDQILSDMARLLSRMTGYTVAVIAKERFGTIERFEGVFVTASSFLLVMITSAGKAITKQLQVKLPLSPEIVEFIITNLNEHLAKKELGSVTLERMIALEKALGDYRSLIGPLIQVIYDVMATLGKENVLVQGISRLLSFPEFQDPEKARAIVEQLEDEAFLLSHFREDSSSGMRVQIAGEGAGLDGASFVFCPFRLRRSLDGAVYIIGPKRMDYGKAMARLEYLAKQIHAAGGFEPKIPLIETKEK